MHDNYASFANFTPGPQDIFDYNIDNLCLKGIDGGGTTVAVIESYTLNPAALGLHPGNHVLTLQGMLITTTASFHS